MKKTNKTFKRFAAITSASLLAACAVAPVAFNAFAAPSTIEITNDDDTANHSYEAYQIFDGDISNDVLTNITWGSGIDTTKEIALLEALAAKNTAFALGLVDYSIAETATETKNAFNTWNSDGDKTVKDYYEHLVEQEAETTGITVTCDAKAAEKIADVLASDSDFDNGLAKDFAEVVAKYLNTSVKKTSVTVNETEAAEDGIYAAYEKDDVIIPGLEDGYYLIQDAASSPSNTVAGENSGAKTRFILKVTDNATIEVNTKASAPTVMKKVQEEDLIGGDRETADFAGKDEYEIGDGYNDVADYDIGDDVPFKLYGTMPSTLNDYDHYYYKFTDTLGSQFAPPTNVVIKIGDVKTLTFNTTGNNNNGTMTYTYANADTSDTNCSVTFANGKFEVTFKDIKAYENNTDPSNIKTVTKDTVVTVDYTAMLNSNAKIGYEGQLNKVELTYSNNPNQEYNPWDTSEDNDTPDTGKTKEDGVIVFTYGFDINKYENGDTTDKLAGAKFAAYYYDADGTTKKYLVVENGLFKGETVLEPTAATNSVWTSTTSDNIVIKGLDVGTYYITEIEAPDGYNKLENDIEVTVSSTIQKENNGQSVASPIYTQNWTYSATANADKTAMDTITVGYSGGTKTQSGGTLATVDIENKAGSSLPGTGGIGTTIFYLGGGAMAAIGGVYLISKRRMRKSEE